VLGYGVIACGVTALVVLNNGGLRISLGESLVLLATLFFALTEFISKRVLEECSIESYVFFRNLVSALIFFTIAVYLFGFEHFAEAFTGELWSLMVVYAGLVVVAAQLFWLKATRVLPVRTIANAQLLNPAFSIFFAFVLLGEAPTRVEWVAVAVIVVGTMIPRSGYWKRERHRGRSVGLGISLVGTH
jgi:drug/metabolite transporter (DMT)-like permease